MFYNIFYINCFYTTFIQNEKWKFYKNNLKRYEIKVFFKLNYLKFYYVFVDEENLRNENSDEQGFLKTNDFY